VDTKAIFKGSKSEKDRGRNRVWLGDEKTIATSQLRLYTQEKKANKIRKGKENNVIEEVEMKNKTSGIKEGKGGAESP
jgi:hypothetical protein